MASADSAPCQPRWPPSRARSARAAGRSTLRLWLDPPLAPSRTRSVAWQATSSPAANTPCTMASGPAAGSWASRPPVRNASAAADTARAASAGLLTRCTPVVAVPMGSLRNTGNRSHRAASCGVRSTALSGCGSPAAASVPAAEILSCTWASAANDGTTVRTPAARSRSARAASTATCSWVGSSTSMPAFRYTRSAAASQGSGPAW